MKVVRGWRAVLLATTLASFLTPFTSSSIAIALPLMASEFEISLASVNWVVNAFLIPLASTVLVFGRISDWLGRSRVFKLGLVLFTISSLAVFTARGFTDLMVYRFIQGLAAAMITSTAIAVLGEVAPRERRGLAIGLNTMAVYLGLSTGPLLGGYLTSCCGWRSLFAFKTLVSLLALLVALKTVESSRTVSPRPSIPVLVFTATSISMIIYGASNLNSLIGLVVALTGCISLSTVLLVERWSSRILHSKLFNTRIIAAVVATLLNYSATYALTVLLSNYLQKLRGLPPSETGLILSIQPVVQVLLSPIAGFLGDHYNPSIIASTGMAVITIGVYSLTLLTPEAPLTQLYPALIILGAGFAFFASPNTTAVLNMSPREAYGSANALLATMRFLGQALSMSIITTIMTIQEDLALAVETSLVIYVFLCIVGTLLSLIPIVKKNSE